MNYKHTQGEWIAEDFIGDHKSRVIYTTEKPMGFCNVYPKPDGEGEANAKLIASAPKLLEALNTVKSTLTEWDKSNIGRYANLIEYMDSVIINATTV